MRFILPILLYFFATTWALSQPPMAVKVYQKGIENLKNRNFEYALKYFEKAVKIYPSYANAHFQLGILYRNYIQNQPLAHKHFKAVIMADSNYANPMAFRMLAELCLEQGKYENALWACNKYLQFPNEPTHLVRKAEIMKRHCEFSLANMHKSTLYRPEPLPPPINQKRKQYFPVLTADEAQLVYTVRDKNKQMEFEDIYVAEKKDNEWHTPVPISEKINSPYRNEGTCSISGDGKTLVFTICNPSPTHKTDCDLYLSYKINNEWQLPQNMGTKVNSVAWDSQPSLSPDGKTLYFSSKRAGGMGEEDIWVTYADENGYWSEPVNCGDIINTPGREVAPFLHANLQTLFFASDYHPGFGSFDLFYSTIDSLGNWNTPINMGYGINNHLEQTSIYLTPKGDKAYFSAEDTAKGTNNYYLYHYLLPENPYIKLKSTYAKGVIIDSLSRQPIGAQIELINLNTGKKTTVTQSDAVTGEYMIVLNEHTEYALFVSKKGYLYKSYRFDFVNEKNFNPIKLNLSLMPIQQGSRFLLENIYFNTGEHKLESKSYSELQRLINFLNENHTVKVEISGHTDNVGLKSQNLELSVRRAESVVDYLIEWGIDSQRITYKGYGDTQPIAPNNMEENRKYNRRIECKIL